MNKSEITQLLAECGEILEISGASPFRVRAFQQGSRALENWQGDLDQLVEEDQVTSIRGIGKGL